MSEKRKRPKKKSAVAFTPVPSTGRIDGTSSSPLPLAGEGPGVRAGEEPGRGDWNLPKPEHIPRPTAWPAGLALGITLFFWGIITSLVVLAMGLAVFIVCLYGWIGEMRHETKQA